MENGNSTLLTAPPLTSSPLLNMLPIACWMHIINVATKGQLFQLATACKFFNNLIYQDEKLSTKLVKYRLKTHYRDVYKKAVILRDEEEKPLEPVDYLAILKQARDKKYKDINQKNFLDIVRRGNITETVPFLANNPQIITHLIEQKEIWRHAFYYWRIQKNQDILDHLYTLIEKQLSTFIASFFSPQIRLFQMAVYCQQPETKLKELLSCIKKVKNLSAELLEPVIECNALSTLKLLQKHGVDIHALNKNKENGLYRAARYGSEDVAAWLIENKVDINAKNHLGHSPLREAISQNRRYIVALFLKNGANPNDTFIEVNSKKQSFLQKMLFQKNEDKAEVPLLIYALALEIRYSHKETIQALLEHGALVNTTSSMGFSSLHAAVYYKNFKHVQLLIKYGANIEADFEGITPLFLACSGKAVKIAQYLIDHGANISATDKYNLMTPLHLAAYSSLRCVQLLLAKKVDVNALSSTLQTPLHLAKNSEIAQALLNAGADPARIDKSGKTVLEEAIKFGHDTTVQFFIEECHHVIRPQALYAAAHWKSEKETATVTESRKNILALLLKYPTPPGYNQQRAIQFAKINWVKDALKHGRVKNGLRQEGTEQKVETACTASPLIFGGPSLLNHTTTTFSETSDLPIPVPPPLPPPGWKASWRRS